MVTIAVVGAVLAFDAVCARGAHVPFGPWLGALSLVALMMSVIPAPFERFDWFKRRLRAERPMMWVVVAMVSGVAHFALHDSIPRADAHTEMLEFAAFWLVGPTLWAVVRKDVRHAGRWLAPLLTATQGVTAALGLAAQGDPRNAWLAAAGTLGASLIQLLVLRKRGAEPVRAAAERSFSRRSRAGKTR